MAGATDLYRDLHNSYLRLKFKVMDAGGANLGANDAVAPTNLLLRSLFAKVSVHLCGKGIAEKYSLYPYRAYLGALLSRNGPSWKRAELV